MKVISEINDCMIKRFERFTECIFYKTIFYYIRYNKNDRIMLYTLIFLLLTISSVHSQRLHTVYAGNYYYQPSSLTIDQGDTVKFVNDGGYHDAAVTSGPEMLQLPACSGPCVIGILVFNKVGNYEYICTIGSHAVLGMVGSIIVNSVQKTANIQIIHNAPYPVVDIYLNDEISLTGIPYRSSTGLINLPVSSRIGIAPTGQGVIADFPLELEQSKNYVLTAFGIVGNDTKPLSISSSTLILNSGNENNFALKVMHGVTDAPDVDIYANGSMIFENIEYGKYSDYLNVPADNYTIDVTAHGSKDAVASFYAPLDTYGGESGIVFASGFLSSADQDSAFTLILSTPNGNKLQLAPKKPDLSIAEQKSNMLSEIYSVSNYPNPFNPTTSINYNLGFESTVNVTIYDILGNVVKELYSGLQTPGKKSINWNATNFKGENVSSGIYFYEIKSSRFHIVKRMMYIK